MADNLDVSSVVTYKNWNEKLIARSRLEDRIDWRAIVGRVPEGATVLTPEYSASTNDQPAANVTLILDVNDGSAMAHKGNILLFQRKQGEREYEQTSTYRIHVERAGQNFAREKDWEISVSVNGAGRFAIPLRLPLKQREQETTLDVDRYKAEVLALPTDAFDALSPLGINTLRDCLDSRVLEVIEPVQALRIAHDLGLGCCLTDFRVARTDGSMRYPQRDRLQTEAIRFGGQEDLVGYLAKKKWWVLAEAVSEIHSGHRKDHTLYGELNSLYDAFCVQGRTSSTNQLVGEKTGEYVVRYDGKDKRGFQVINIKGGRYKVIAEVSIGENGIWSPGLHSGAGLDIENITHPNYAMTNLEPQQVILLAQRLGSLMEKYDTVLEPARFAGEVLQECMHRYKKPTR